MYYSESINFIKSEQKNNTLMENANADCVLNKQKTHLLKLIFLKTPQPQEKIFEKHKIFWKLIAK